MTAPGRARSSSPVASLILKQGELRLTLAVMVLLSHMSHLIIGRLAVDLFFMLSGFWISALWVRTEAPGRVRNFYLNRFLRIYPLYILTAVACILLFHGTNISPSTFALFGVANSKWPRAIGVEWSLDIEAQFYLFFPILFALFERFKRYRLYAVCALSAIGCGLSYLSGAELAITHLPMFYAGMVLHERHMSGKTFGVRAALLSLLAFVSVFAVAFAVPALRAEVWLDGRPALLDTNLFDLLWAATLIPFVGQSLRLRSNARDRVMGDLSYPLYLIHEPVIRILQGTSVLGAMAWFSTPSPAVKLASIAVVLVAASAIYLLVDRPIEAWRKRTLFRPAKEAEPYRLAA